MANLPEAGGVAWTELYTPEGVKINLTSRAATPAMAWKNLVSAIEETGALTVRPALNRQPQPEAPKQAPQGEQVAVAGNNLGLLDRKPKASDLNPGDRYEIQVDEYKATAQNVKFYRDGMQYPDLTHNMVNDYARGKFNELFNNWHPDEDEERHPIPGGSVILAVQCTEKLNKNGNPYQNLDGMRRPE